MTCSLFSSRCGDRTFGTHGDAWLGAIVQVAGAKELLIGESLLDGSGVPPARVTTRAGDILFIPRYRPHAASTPADPGHSAHLSFAISRDQPEGGMAGT